jgi:hypothetical protein
LDIFYLNTIMKTHIVICKTYDGTNRTIWLENCESFWAAVEKARYLPQKKLNYPAAPVCDEFYMAARTHEWHREKTKIDIENGDRIKEVIEIREWTLG